MKIAILLTGQLRTFELVKYIHMNNLISKYDADVFLSIDVDNTLQCENKNSTTKTTDTQIENAISFFNPTDWFVCDNFDYEFNNLTNKTNIDLNPHKILLQQYFIVYNAYNLLVKHINKTNTEYDIIIRLRFDQFIWTDNTYIFDNLDMKNGNLIYNNKNINASETYSTNGKIDFNEIINNNIYLFGFGKYLHYNYANDQFWYHNMTLINTMYNFYENMLLLLEYCSKNNIGNNGAMIECMFYTYLTQHNINMTQTNVKGLFVREFL